MHAVALTRLISSVAGAQATDADACDPQFCVVVDPANPTDCLNPQTAFRVLLAAVLLRRRRA